MKIVRMALLATAVASAPEARAHDGAAPHGHGSADPRPLAAVESRSHERSAEEIAALLDRVEERRQEERRAHEATTPSR
ncbi:MAG: hypothetical protein ACKOCT_16260 [Alphaproteobacteria bacterium]